MNGVNQTITPLMHELHVSIQKTVHVRFVKETKFIFKILLYLTFMFYI